MEKKNTVKIENVLLYFGISAALSALLKKLFKREDMNIFLHALALTLGWLVGNMITDCIDEQ